MNAKLLTTLLMVTAVGQAAVVSYCALTRDQSSPTTTTGQRVQPKSENIPAASDISPPRSPTEPAIPAGSKFDWSSLENADFEQYIANLRAIGCPEQTVRDIILAEVNKLYAPREAEFRTSTTRRSKGLLPWEAQPSVAQAAQAADAKAEFERRRQLRDIEREKAAVIKKLLGIDLPLSPLRGWRGRNYDRVEAALDAMPAEKRERVREIQEVYWQASDTLNDQFKDKERGPEFAGEYKRLNDERKGMLAAVLTPAELDDYEMRSSSQAQQLGNELAGFKASEQEFRSIYAARRGLDEQADPDAQADPAARQALDQAARDQIREALGDERFAQYERAKDPAWQQLSKLESRFSLEPAKVEEAYGLVSGIAKQASEAAAAFAAAGSKQRPGDVSPELLARWQGWQGQLEQVKGLLGEKAALVMEARLGSMLPNIEKQMRIKAGVNSVPGRFAVPNSFVPNPQQ